MVRGVMPINVLAPDVAAKIAAGEVIERPSSVVKELVENSLDAGASQITVEVKGGGTELIRVIDNGSGIPAEEAELAFLRHATSKIHDASDLDSINTLGFRGEALPSIAAVAKVTLTTRTHVASVGRMMQVEWGKLISGTSKGCPAGATVEVRSLFENLPARKKFLKSPSSERTRISDLMSRFALAFPEIQFRLIAEGRNTLNTPGSGDLRDAVTSVYGADTGQAMLEVSSDQAGSDYSAMGLISPPSLHRANRSYITFLLNRRWIQSPLLSFALSECYQGFLPERRHPTAVINLKAPLADVDVNVHPAKREVRFRQEDRVFSALQRAVRAALISISPVPEMHVPSASAFPSRWQRPDHRTASVPMGRQDRNLPLPLSSQNQAATPIEAMSSLRILGQVRNTYLVSEGADGLYLIDQHAAHERVLFEKVSREVSEKTSQVQALLEPAAVELSPSQEELAQSSMDLLGRYGFVLEQFGDRTYLVRAVPSVTGKSDPATALLEILDMMAYEGVVKEREDALAASIACHSAVRAGMALSQQQMDELVKLLEACDSPHTCPHGRPTMIHLSSHHLEREFGRT